MEASALSAPAALTRGSGLSPWLRLRSDEQLVGLFRSGSEEAFRVIHDRYRQRLYGYARQMLGGSGSDAEDVMQGLGVASKLNADWEFLLHLHDTGWRCAEAWLGSAYGEVGHKSTVDVHGKYL